MRGVAGEGGCRRIAKQAFEVHGSGSTRYPLVKSVLKPNNFNRFRRICMNFLMYLQHSSQFRECVLLYSLNQRNGR